MLLTGTTGRKLRMSALAGKIWSLHLLKFWSSGSIDDSIAGSETTWAGAFGDHLESKFY